MAQWTDDQQSAICAKWCDAQKTKSANILVNAAAGSGKTAVLVERIINKVTADTNSHDYAGIDNLLVVTFTNAAAKEMQERIANTLTQKYNDAYSAGDFLTAQHLKEQLSLLSNSDITTIDAFCLKTVRNYFHLLNIDPGFKISDSAENALLADEAMDEMFEDCYNNPDFIDLLCIYADNRDDRGLSQIIKEIYKFTRSLSNPEKWLEEKKEIFNSYGNNIWFSEIKKVVSEYAQNAAALTFDAIKLMINYINDCSISDADAQKYIGENQPEQENDLYYAFGTYYYAMYSEYMFYKSITSMRWDEMYSDFGNMNYIRINAKPKFSDPTRLVKDSEILNPIKLLREKSKKIFNEQIKPLVYADSESILNESREKIYPVICALVKYVLLFEKYYDKKKESKNVKEFSDIEHLCLKLFRENEQMRNELREKYSEILMDEYQDSNSLQEEIFSCISSGDNFFMVGDMKQSIYRFRSSDPDLFKAKCETYIKDENAPNRKIVLSKNFRSRKEILEGVNSIFECIMSEAVGGIEYDDDQKLYYGDTTYEDKNGLNCGGYKNECYILLQKNENEDNLQSYDSDTLQARFIAKKIKEMKDNKFLIRYKRTVKMTDDNGEEKEESVWDWRPVQNKDFVILMSSYKNTAKIYLRELSAIGIDCYVHTDGYFDRIEISLMVSVLKAISNPFNDIALIAVMRSFIFNFTDDELSVIRLFSKEKFYNCVKSAANNAKDADLKQKCTDFTDTLNRWRKYSKFMSSDRLIWQLYEDTAIYSFMQAIYGEEAIINLRLLFDRAKQYESSGYKGIFNFIRYIGKIRRSEEKINSAVLASETSDVVRIMTIHKSKGLEFPVVFLADASKKFNLRDASGRLIVNKDLGFGADYVNYEDSTFSPTLSKLAVSKRILSDSISEEVRKLYVAMTRAKEKLIVTAVSEQKNTSLFDENPIPSEFDEWNSVSEKMPVFKSASVRRFIDWIAPAAINDTVNWNFNIVKYSDILSVPDTILDLTETEIKNAYENITITDNSYRYADETSIPVKVSVSQIKQMGLNNSDTLIKYPLFMQKHSGLTGAQKGTAIHYAMQKFLPDENMSIEMVKEFIKMLADKNELTKSEAESINPQAVIDFYNSQLGQRIMKSDKVVREAPFEMEIPACEIFDTKSDVPIIVQGVIDCYFYEDDGIVIVDYKSDYYNDIDEIKQKYAVQIAYYKVAVEKICQKSVKNQFLYLFLTNNVIEY